LEQLKGLQPADRIVEEKREFAEFEEQVNAIKARRTEYRRMLADAYTQRSHLLDSMLLNQRQDEIIRTQVEFFPLEHLF